MKETKIFIGPMSKNIVDSVIEFSNNSGITLGLIPSRRQVESDGGYVNNWKTLDFCEYVRSKTDKVLLVRDHSGPGQGYYEDDGIESFKNDCKSLTVKSFLVKVSPSNHINHPGFLLSSAISKAFSVKANTLWQNLIASNLKL